MKCRKCKKEIEDDSKFCRYCGTKQDIAKNPKSRGNGQGSVFQLPNKKWIAIKTIGYKADENGKMHRVTKSKQGFKTKKDAIEYLHLLTDEPKINILTFYQTYQKWEPTHRAGRSTMYCYEAAIKYFEPVWFLPMDKITIDDLQECMDECTKGKRTRQNMKTICGLLYKYAIPRKIATINMAQYLVVGSDDKTEKNALPDEAVEAIQKNIGKVPYADYVYCHCFLGFRPSEFLNLDAKEYNRKEKAFTGGAKTEAGKNRIVTISPKIQPIIDRLTNQKISGPVFCAEDGKKMPIETYRARFYEVLDACGIDNPITEKDGVKRRKYTPHSCRHTFATMMKRIDAPEKDKLELIGHASPEMLRYYQDVSFDDIRKITNAL